MSTRPVRRNRSLPLVMALGALILIANECVSRGYVTDGERRPLHGADVWFADSARVVHRLRTDRAGFFWVLHAPFARRRLALLICEGRHRMFVNLAPTSALVRSEYDIGAYLGRFPDTPAERGWTVEAPPSCPARSPARAD